MKQPKKPTRAQKEHLVNNNKNPKDWMVVAEYPKHVLYINKHNNKTVLLNS